MHPCCNYFTANGLKFGQFRAIVTVGFKHRVWGKRNTGHLESLLCRASPEEKHECLIDQLAETCKTILDDSCYHHVQFKLNSFTDEELVRSKKLIKNTSHAGFFHFERA